MKGYFILWFLVITINLFSQKESKIYPIGFYNLENLFDTKREIKIYDEDFTPSGKFRWTEDKYRKKLNNLAYVINQLGKDSNPDGFAILGVAEVENEKVIRDLINMPLLKNKNYKIVHKDSPDPRGIDVGLIYNPAMFTVSSYKIYPFKSPGRKKNRTRDILVVSGTLAGESVCILVNHWPSRQAEGSEALRERAGSICKQISDSIFRNNPKTGIIIMGDMNDNPNDRSTKIALNAKWDKRDVKSGGLFNTMWQIYDNGVGSLKYKGKWDLFDQIIISQNLLSEGINKLIFQRAYVFNKDFLFQKSGRFKGYPLRTFSGTTFLNGYSDHFPTLIYLTKEN